MSVSRSVDNIIRKKPFIQEALSRGIINVASLAEELKPEVEKDLNKTVKFSAVNMALRRAGEKIKKQFETDIKIGKDVDLLIRSDLIELALYKTREVQKSLQNIYNLFNEKDNIFLTVTQGLNEIMIICNKRYEAKVTNNFRKIDIKKKITKLSSITINIPETGINTHGLFYTVTRALHWENINIIDIVSTFTEMGFVIKEYDTSRAYEVLRKIIDEKAI